MSILAILALSQATSAQAILTRYSEFRKKNPAFSADWKLGVGAHELSHGTIMLDGTKRVLFRANWGEESYSLSESEKGVIEIAPHDATYDEWPAIPFVAAPPSRLGSGAQFLPQPLLHNSVYVPNLKYSVEPSITVNGEKADVVSWTVVIQMRPIKFELAIDPEGRIVEFSRGPGKTEGQEGSPRGMPQALPSGRAPSPPALWTISNYHTISHTSLLAFFTPLPRGYVPYAMPSTSDVRIQVDDAFPSVPWKSGATTLDLAANAAGKPEVILITAPDCAPSQKALADFDKIKAEVPGINFSAVSLARTAAEAHGLPYDSTGKASAAVGDTSTPLFVLVDGKGKITNLWAGFDPDSAAAFGREIASAAKKLTSAQS